MAQTKFGMKKHVCVFSSSSDNIDRKFFEAAEELGVLIAKNNYTLVYGGARVGLMGMLAKTVHANGGEVVGIIPGFLKDKELAYEAADEMIVTKDMRDRKTIMEERSDAFVALPGGFGTVEEILEILTLKLLKRHNKPIVLINTNNFYGHMINFFNHMVQERFAKDESREHYSVVSSATEAISYIAVEL
ncbi:MAG: LOG family protein [Candidatus Anammoxibacter sp.]